MSLQHKPLQSTVSCTFTAFNYPGGNVASQFIYQARVLVTSLKKFVYVCILWSPPSSAVLGQSSIKSSTNGSTRCRRVEASVHRGFCQAPRYGTSILKWLQLSCRTKIGPTPASCRSLYSSDRIQCLPVLKS